MKQLIIVVLFMISSFALGEEATIQFDQANQLYRTGNYKEAAQLYEKITATGYENTMLYYNLGNAYFKLQEFPAAILNYERAKRLSPHDEDMLYNLRLANLRITDRIEPLPRLFLEDWWRALMTLYSSDGWSVAGIAGLWCALITGVMFVVVRSFLAQRIIFVVSSLILLFTTVAFVGMFQQHHREEADQHAIVFAPSVSVKSAPDNQSVDLFVLHEGVNVELLDSVGDWKKIRLSDGKIGWITVNTIEVI